VKSNNGHHHVKTKPAKPTRANGHGKHPNKGKGKDEQ
jgi:hypothetical protein